MMTYSVDSEMKETGNLIGKELGVLIWKTNVLPMS